MQTLPPVIRTYLAQGKYTIVAQNLMAKYGLRIDQGGVLEREIMLLLMGIDNPDEFTQALVEEAKLDQKSIAGIVNDINTQVFVPLRAEEMKSGAENMQSSGAAPSAALRPMVVPVPGGAPRPPVVSGGVVKPQSNFHLENKIVPPPRPVQPSATIPKLAQPSRLLNPASTGPSSRPALRDVLAAVTKTPNARMLEDHEEPHIEFSPLSKVQESTAKVSVPPVSQRAVPQPANLPGVAHPRVVPFGARPTFTPAPNLTPRAIAAPPAPAVPASLIAPKAGAPITPVSPRPSIAPAPVVSPAAPVTPPVPAKPYAGDPYREPIEP